MLNLFLENHSSSNQLLRLHSMLAGANIILVLIIYSAAHSSEFKYHENIIWHNIMCFMNKISSITCE